MKFPKIYCTLLFVINFEQLLIEVVSDLVLYSVRIFNQHALMILPTVDVSCWYIFLDV